MPRFEDASPAELSSQEHPPLFLADLQLLGKYLHGLCARVFDLWAGVVSGNIDRRAFVERQILSMISGRAEFMLGYVFAGWQSLSEVNEAGF